LGLGPVRVGFRVFGFRASEGRVKTLTPTQNTNEGENKIKFTKSEKEVKMKKIK
jgi:hypothetical protein